MPEKTDKQIRDYVKDKVATALGAFGNSKLYSDYEILKDMSKFEQVTKILHKGITTLVETKGTGIAEYETLYTVVVIVQRGKVNVSTSSEINEEQLDRLVEGISNTLIADNSSSTRPYSNPAVIQEYGIGVEEDVVGIPGGDEKDWKGLLMLYVKVTIFHRRIF